jgi:ketosteroid isomerase-like protein
MDTTTMRDEAKRFIEDYRDAFSRGARAIAEFYAEPCVTARMGIVRVNPTRNDIELLFAEVDRNYRSRGFTHGEILGMEIHPLGSNSAFATVWWAYKGADAKTLWETTFSYNLYRRDGIWKILVQTMHDS